MKTQMLPKEVVKTLDAIDMGDYYYCSYMLKGVKHWRRVHKCLDARRVRKVMVRGWTITRKYYF